MYVHDVASMGVFRHSPCDYVYSDLQWQFGMAIPALQPLCVCRGVTTQPCFTFNVSTDKLDTKCTLWECQWPSALTIKPSEGSFGNRDTCLNRYVKSVDSDENADQNAISNKSDIRVGSNVLAVFH